MPRQRVNAPGRGAKERALMQEQPIPRGLCQCGCGQHTPLARQTKRSRGNVAGEPVRYISGHNGAKTREKFKVDPETGCWVWQRCINPRTGYGQLTVARQVMPAHRWSYEHHVGPIPAGMHIDHLCRNRPCVNPAHLEVVSLAENNRRAARHRTNDRVAMALGSNVVDLSSRRKGA